jgi:hypothetical protein
MLSYTLPAAIKLLKSKLAVAQTSLQTTVEDLEFLREQITSTLNMTCSSVIFIIMLTGRPLSVLEVNTARVFNWDVKRRREQRERESASEKAPALKI